MRAGAVERFWARVSKTETCWVWTGGKFASGYGSVKWNGKSRRAHRVSAEMVIGPIPEGLEVCHRCDNPACVRPDHLFLGTHAENCRDRDDKGRNVAPVGERCGASKLTESQVMAIRADKSSTTKQIAAMCGVHVDTIRNVLNGRNWRHL